MSKLKIYTLIEAWNTIKNSSFGENVYTFLNLDEAKSEMQRRYVKECESGMITDSMVKDETEFAIESYEYGYFCDEHYTLKIVCHECNIPSWLEREIRQRSLNESYLDDCRILLSSDEYSHVSDAEKDKIFTDEENLADKVQNALDKNEDYGELYWLTIKNVLDDQLKCPKLSLSVNDYADRLTNLRMKCKEVGAEFYESFYDNAHLDCFWYDGGGIASINYKNHTIFFDVCGDIAVTLYKDGIHHLLHRAGNHPLFNDDECRAYIKDDEMVRALMESDVLQFHNNNWINIVVMRDSDNKYVTEPEVASETNLLAACENNMAEFIRRIDELELKGELNEKN